MNFKKNDMNIKCPYFINESRLQITCEGVSRNTKLALKFQSEKEKISYIKRVCEHYPNRCQITAVLEDKYKENE